MKKAIRELALAAAGAIYLLLVFFRNMYSPVLAVLLVTLFAHELIDARRARHKQ